MAKRLWGNYASAEGVCGGRGLVGAAVAKICEAAALPMPCILTD